MLAKACAVLPRGPGRSIITSRRSPLPLSPPRQHYRTSTSTQFVGKAAALGVGFFLRLFYKELTPSHKAMLGTWSYWRAALIRSPKTLTVLGVATVGVGAFAYSAYTPTPITNRGRFIWTEREGLVEYAGAVRRLIDREQGRNYVHMSTPTFKRVHSILSRLLVAIEQHPELGPLQRSLNLSFSLEVVDNKDPEMFVLPNGAIFVYTGYLEEIKSDDAFAAMLAHEISHALLQHRAEETSLRDAVTALAAASWAVGFAAVGTVGKAGMLSLLGDAAASDLITPAFRRDLENEADLVGMVIAARACFDPRTVPAEWQRIAQEVPQTRTGLDKLTLLTDTHPSHEARVESLNAYLPRAMEEAKACKCSFASTAPPTMKQP